MSAFDAVTHAMTTLSTGGYSTRNASIAAFNSEPIELIITGGMILGALPFVHYLAIVRGSAKDLFYDPEVRWFLILMAIIVSVIAFNLHDDGMGWTEAFRLSSFNTISMMTGTGYGTTDFVRWGGAELVILLICMFLGGCAGSTTCGIKMFRLQILAANIRVQIALLLRPHAVVLAHYNGRAVSESAMNAVMAFFYLYILCFVVLSIILGLTGLDFTTALSGAATTLSNVGPGLSESIGPMGTFGTLPDIAKWAMCVGMLLGRLELFTVLVILNPAFWRR